MEKIKPQINNLQMATNFRRMATKTKIFVAICVIFAAISGAKVASAASLYFSPSSGSHAVGTTLSVSIYVSSADQAMNAASGVISFPRDKLEVTSLSKTGSIFTLWVQEPSFSNPPAGGQGTVNFEGIVLNPGFTGSSGKAITITFRTKAAGNAPLTFSSGSALANDGKGTNILATLGNAQFSLGGAAPTIPESTTPSISSGAPFAPQISSPTHPDPNKWYASKNAKFTWSVSSGVTGVRLLADKTPAATPTVVYTPAINEKEVTNIDDGIWYFHTQLRNANGWGEISHFRFQIDTEPPEPFVIKFIEGKETDNPRPTALFDTTDSLSGTDYYRIKIGEGDFFSTLPEIIKSNPFVLPLQAPGKRTILVQAYDKAGNYTTASEEFFIKPLEPPVFTEVPQKLTSGEILKVSGKTGYSRGEILVLFQRENEKPKSQTVKPNADGSFTAVAEERVKDGIYKVWAEVIDERGARSTLSEKITISVERPAFLKIGSWAVSLLAVVVPLAALVFILLFIIWYGWHKFSALRKRLRKEVREAESALHKAFDLLKEDVQEQIKMLEKTRTKRKLTEEEEKILEQLKNHLDNAEKFIRKEIEDVRKEVT